MKQTAAITVRDLIKSFKENNVLKGVNFTVQEGSTFALLGSNGAGKTTILKILATLMLPDEGRAEIFGYDVVKQASQVRTRISYTGQNAAVDEILSGRENLRIIGALRHMPDKKARADNLLELFRLTDAANKPVARYSGGMRRRLDIAMSMMSKAPVVFMDEPTTGLDPQNRLVMWDIIKSMAKNGTTVFLTTQYLDEAEHLADYIAILHEGVIIAYGTVDELKQKLPQGLIQFKFRNEKDMKKAMELLDGYSIYNGEEEYAITVQTDGGAKQFENVLCLLNQGGIKIMKFNPKQPTLEDAFLVLIGEKEDIYRD